VDCRLACCLEFARQVILALGRWIKVNVPDKWSGPEILACHEAAIAVTLPKPVTSGIEAKGHFGNKTSALWLRKTFTFVLPGERLAYSFTTQDKGMVLRRYRTNACQRCPIKRECTTGKDRRQKSLGDCSRGK
jgi:hypothetical protein